MTRPARAGASGAVGVALVLLALAASAVVSFRWCYEPDLWWHLAHGREIAAGALPRTNLFSAVFRIRSLAAQAIHEFFHDKGFLNSFVISQELISVHYTVLIVALKTRNGQVSTKPCSFAPNAASFTGIWVSSCLLIIYF